MSCERAPERPSDRQHECNRRLGARGITPENALLAQQGGGGVGGVFGAAQGRDGDVARGDGLIHVDSYGQIAIAVSGGRADAKYGLAVRTAVGFRSPETTRIQIIAAEDGDS